MELKVDFFSALQHCWINDFFSLFLKRSRVVCIGNRVKGECREFVEICAKCVFTFGMNNREQYSNCLKGIVIGN